MASGVGTGAAEGSSPPPGDGGGMGADDGSSGGGIPGRELREQDRFLPIANINRIMKRALPHNAKIAKDAKETMQECVSEFVSFITSEASEKCAQEKRKTVSGDDIIWAMQNLSFDNYLEPLKLYLFKYREADKQQAGQKRGTGASRLEHQPLQSAALPGVHMQMPLDSIPQHHPHHAQVQQQQRLPGQHYNISQFLLGHNQHEKRHEDEEEEPDDDDSDE